MYGLRCQLTGAVHLSNWNGTNSKVNETEVWETVINEDYNARLKPLIRNWDLYHILPRPDGKNWDGLEYVDPEAEDIQGAVMLWKPKGAADAKNVKLRGLDAETSYQLTFSDHTSLNCVMTGAQLMNEGLTVTFDETVASDIIWMTRAEQPSYVLPQAVCGSVG